MSKSFKGRSWKSGDSEDYVYVDEPGSFFTLPSSWVFMNPGFLEGWVRKEPFTVKMMAVLIVMLKRMTYGNLVSGSCLDLAKEAQVCRATVIRAVRLFEEWGVMKKISEPRAASEWQINPGCFCKVFPKKELSRG
jgi:hypothetical protein